MKLKRWGLATAVLVAAGGLMGGSTAVATDGSGTTPTNVVMGTIDGPLRAKQDGVSLKVREDTTVRTFELTYAIGGYSGWHAHPGIVVAVVKEGAVVRQAGCAKPETFTVGQAFTEVGTHFVRNQYTAATEPGAVPAVLSITQIYPAGDPPREDRQPPKCHHHHG
jgi:quercetin dioxygenase-like cupin family protein